MSNYAITVDTGSRRYSNDELLSFYRNVGVMQSAVENMKGSVRGLRTGLQRANRCFLQMGTAVRGVLSGLMDTRNVVDGLRSGMKNLYAYSRTWWRSFAGTLESLAGNAVYLRNSLAAMAAPMLKALAPAIEFVTDKFVGLFNLINQFFARLTGSSTYVAARRVSGSIDGVGASASQASDEVTELERQLAGFDELNVLSEYESSSGSGGGGGSGGSGGGVQFEERQIDNALAGFVDALKSAFNAGDWQELGTLIGTKINEMVEGVDWAAAGSKVGFYINGLFSSAYWTLETVNFTNIGKSVAEFLNNALAEIDFTTVGATIALLFTSLAETIAGFVDEFDWVQFAEKLADGFNGFVSKLGEKLDAIDWAGLALKMTEGLNAFIAKTDWANAGTVLAGRVNDLLEILGTAAANFDWTGAGKALATAVNNLFKNVDWDGLGTWLNDTLLGVLDFGIAFFQGFDAVGFANDVGRALAKVDWNAVSEKLWTLFKAALEKLGEFFGTLLFGGSADMKLNLALLKDGWETITKWLGIDDPVSALVNLLKGKPGTVGEVYSETDKKVTGTTSLTKGTSGTQTVNGVYTDADKKVTGTTSLAKGKTGAQTASTVYTDADKQVSVVANLTKTGSNWATNGITKWFGGGKNPVSTFIADLTRTGSNWKVKGGFTKWFGGGNNPGANFIANLTRTGSNWKEKGGFTKWFGGGNNPGANFIANLTGKGSNWKKQGGSAKWILSETNGAVDFIANLTQQRGKEKSNFYGIGSAGWILGQTDGAVSFIANLTQQRGKEKSNFYGIGSAGWILGQTDGAVSFIANLASERGGDKSNYKKKGGAAKWILDDTDDSVSFLANLEKNWNGSATSALSLDNLSTTVKVFIEQAGSTWQKIKDFLRSVGININTGGVIANGQFKRFASGGITTNAGVYHPFASGGVIAGGVARYLANVPHYAGGTTRAHGTIFVAGEAGPEIMGHINGRTEILNKSQLAQTMYSAVLSAMSQAVSALGTFLSGQLANCTNAIVKTVSGLSAVANIQYHQPVMATGTVLPYDVAAQIARAGMDIQNTLDANNEDLIQTIISVAGQIVAAVQASNDVGALSERPRAIGNRPYTAQQVIDDINRRAQMFGSSPVLN